jgi:hypothetical protein
MCDADPHFTPEPEHSLNVRHSHRSRIVTMRLRSVSIKNRSSSTTVYIKLRCQSRIEAMRLRTPIRIDHFTIGLRQFFTGAVSQHGAV